MPKMIKGLEPPFEPHLCQAAIDRFEQLINRDSVVFEWGSGSSTLWLARRTFLTVSVEHKAEWFDEVTTRHDAANATIYLVTNPLAYAMMIDEFPDRMFDVVFIDGLDITRLRCVEQAMPKLKPGGWIIVDDTNWPMLRPLLVKDGPLEGWERESHQGIKNRWVQIGGKVAQKQVMGKTSFFQKPEG